MVETAETHRQVAFHLTGAPGGDLESPESSVRPALLAGYRDLTALRYDFPVVLVHDAVDGTYVRSLSSVLDDVLREIAPRGIEGERLRRQVLRAEREVRRLVAEGARGTLTDLWAAAAPSLAEVGTHFPVDGELADCDHALPGRLVEHAWRSVQREKARRFHGEVDRLVQSLSDILRAAFIHSEAGRQPESLQAAFGALHHDQFDFETMSRLLTRGSPRDELSADRRERIEWALEVLRRQPFFEPSRGTEVIEPAESTFDYRYGSCVAAAEAFRERLPKVVEFVKAMSIAHLEADGRYVRSEHDEFLENFDEDSLSRQDLARFPDYLVTVEGDESMAVMELLSSHLPFKVLVETNEVLASEKFGVGMRSTQLASTAVGLIDVFALQATSSSLYRLRDRLLAGLLYTGPTVVSIFAGSATASGDLPPYLVAAAALEGRAFPAFTYDPGAGSELASRFSVDENPQPELDWPLAELDYADVSLQRTTDRVAFTLVDFAVCDRRYARHFARVPREQWDDRAIPVDEWLSLDPSEADAYVPYILVVDDNDSLQRLIVDAKLMHAARRGQELWHELRQLGLVRLRAPAPPDSEAVIEAAIDALEESAAPQPSDDTIVDEHTTDDPWIETPRCSTCNECTGINDRMFAYNENKQAYIKDPDAGTFRELVEAAEACQVAVIHPGKPRNPSEPELEGLVERAKTFQ
jgi:hypothetical protein